MKTTIKVVIERGKDDRFSAHTDYEYSGYGLLGYGETAQKAIADFMASYEEAKEMLKDEGTNAPELEFEFYYDMSSFLDYYNGVLSKVGLEKITGIHQKQLWHYYSGARHPKPATIRKIQESLHNFADELKQVRFID